MSDQFKSCFRLQSGLDAVLNCPLWISQTTGPWHSIPQREDGLLSCDVNHHCKGLLKKMPKGLLAGLVLGWCSGLQRSFSEISAGRQ